MITVKIEYIRLGNFRYPMVMSLYTIQQLEKRFGGLENTEKAMNEQKDGQIELVVDLIHMLIESGTEYLNQVGIHPDGCDYNENGDLRMISKKGIGACLIGMTEIENAIGNVKRVFENANAKQIRTTPRNTESKKKKNRSTRRTGGSMYRQGH